MASQVQSIPSGMIDQPLEDRRNAAIIGPETRDRFLTRMETRG
jgi:hypothetical protein